MRFSTKLLPSRSGNLGIVQLNNPKALHALTLEMAHAFQDVLEAWEQDESLQAILVRATAAKRPAFCAGGDVKAVYEAGIAFGSGSSTAATTTTPRTLGQGEPGSMTSDFFRYEYQLNHAIATCSKPYISILDGVVMGGGVGISIHGKYRVATENTVFSMPETALGLFPDVGSTFWLPRMLRRSSNNSSLGMCYYLALTGKRLGAADLVHTGLATHYVPASRLDELQKALVDATNSSNNVTAGEGATDKDVVAPVLKKFHVTPQFPEPRHSFLAQHEEEIEQAFGSHQKSKTTVEDMIEALKGLDTEFGRETLSALEKASPTSLKVTLEGMQRGALLNTIEDCLRMEFRMGQRCLREGSDFYEGVRAILVDKDQSPKWNPSTLADVSAETVESYFAPLSSEWEPSPKAPNRRQSSNL